MASLSLYRMGLGRSFEGPSPSGRARPSYWGPSINAWSMSAHLAEPIVSLDNENHFCAPNFGEASSMPKLDKAIKTRALGPGTGPAKRPEDVIDYGGGDFALIREIYDGTAQPRQKVMIVLPGRQMSFDTQGRVWPQRQTDNRTRAAQAAGCVGMGMQLFARR